MYSATFTFSKGEYDAEFHQLDNAIAQLAQGIPGYLGEEAWDNASNGLISTVYYWESLEALQALMNHPSHLKAKQHYAKWIKGYHIVIAQVLSAHGDGGIAHPLTNVSKR